MLVVVVSVTVMGVAVIVVAVEAERLLRFWVKSGARVELLEEAVEENVDVTSASVVGREGGDEDAASVAKDTAEVVADVASEVAADADVAAEIVADTDVTSEVLSDADVAAEVSIEVVQLVVAVGFVVSVIATLGDDCTTVLVALGSAGDV